MTLRAEDEPVGLLDSRNPDFVQYGQDWEALLSRGDIASLTSDISAIPQRQEAVLSEVTNLRQQLQELINQRKGARRILAESHQRRGGRHFWSFLPWFNKGPNIEAIRAQNRDFGPQITTLEERVKETKDGTQGRVDALNTERLTLEGRKFGLEQRWATSDGSYRVVRFAFEQTDGRFAREQLFRAFIGPQRPTPYLNVEYLQQTYQAMVDEDLIRKGLKKPPRKIEPEPQSPSPTAHQEVSQPTKYTFEVEGIKGLRTVSVATPRELGAAMLGVNSLQCLAAKDVLVKLSHISAIPDKEIARFGKVEWGHFKDYYIIPMGKHWLIYYQRSRASERFGIQRV